MVAVSPWVFPGFARLGQLSQTSDRLYSCDFPDWQSRPSSATGAGGFEVLIANCKVHSISLTNLDLVYGVIGLHIGNYPNYPTDTWPRDRCGRAQLVLLPSLVDSLHLGADL